MRRMKINIYKLKDFNLVFIIDEGCELFVEMIIEMLDIKGGMDRVVIIFIQFGKIEIIISVRDKIIG